MLCMGQKGLIVGLFVREVILIEFSTFCNAIYPRCPQIKSQGMFVSKLFVAAGSKYFSASTTSDKDYQKKLYNGSKPLNQNLRDSFSNSIRFDSAVAFFTEYIDDDNTRDLMAAFAIPTSVEPDKTLLSKALAAQLQLLIQSEKNDVDDIVATEYQKLMIEPAAEPAQQLAPLYPGDSAWVLECKPQRSYLVHCYDKFQHTWVIRNNGSQTWRGRKLVFANCNEVRPRADVNSIDISDTPPGKEIKIATGFDARGFEGKFDCVWEMQDSDGKNCFPNNKRQFCITINTKFKAE